MDDENKILISCRYAVCVRWSGHNCVGVLRECRGDGYPCGVWQRHMMEAYNVQIMSLLTNCTHADTGGHHQAWTGSLIYYMLIQIWMDRRTYWLHMYTRRWFELERSGKRRGFKEICLNFDSCATSWIVTQCWLHFSFDHTWSDSARILDGCSSSRRNSWVLVWNKTKTSIWTSPALLQGNIRIWIR